MSSLLVVAATRMELGFLGEDIAHREGPPLAFRRGGWTALVCGIGKSNAAWCVGQALVREKVSRVMLVGLAGGQPGLEIGTLVIGREVVDADLGVRSASGWTGLSALGFPSVSPYFNRLPCDPTMASIVEKTLQESGHPSVAGAIHTSDTVSGTVRLGAGRCERLDTIAEAMEGTGVATACHHQQIPFVELRVISNHIGKRSSFDLDRACTALDQGLRDLYSAELW